MRHLREKFKELEGERDLLKKDNVNLREAEKAL